MIEDKQEKLLETIKDKISKSPKVKSEKDFLAEKGISHEQEQDLRRSDDYIFGRNIKRKFYNLFLYPVFIVCSISVALLIITVISHMALPEDLRWLPEEDVTRIEEMLKAGVVGALISMIARKIIS